MKSWCDYRLRYSFESSTEVSAEAEPSQDIINWLNELALLKGVPLNYLLPGEKVLPEESIRFFYIDNNWINNLLDGACSIGRHNEEYNDDNYLKQSLAPRVGSCRNGFLLRSMLVDGWPGLEVLGYNGDEEVSKERLERLSNSVLLCMFKGEVDRIIIRKPAESLHFSFDMNGEKFVKKIPPNAEIEVPFRDEEKRVIKIENLAESFAEKLAISCSSAVFSCCMVDKRDEIVFEIKGS